VIALARLPLARLVRTRRAALPLLGWSVVAFGATLLARHGGGSSDDRALLGVFAPFVMPLVAYAIVSAALGGEGVSSAAAPLVRFGAAPRLCALAAAVVATAACALVCSAMAALLVLAAHNPADPPLARDAMLSAYGGALGGAAHGAFFVLGAAITARGGGRAVALVVNWLLGAAPGWAAVLVPYAHARSLLGGEPAVMLSERASAWSLGVIIVVCLGLTTLRVRR
jgi:hypothetical protein